MKTRTFYCLFSFAASIIFVMTSCVKEGPVGEAGTEVCNSCHGAASGSKSLVTRTTELFQASGHGDYGSGHRGGSGEAAFYVRSGSSCMGCHSHEGAQVAFETGSPYNLPDEVLDGTVSKMTCATCHNVHDKYTVEDDLAVRHFEGEITFAANNTESADFGTDNNCALCHQLREGKAAPDKNTPGEDITWTGTHYGMAANVFAYGGGTEFEGTLNYPASNKHEGISCTACHLTKPQGTEGGHTFKVNYDNACSGCHSDYEVTLANYEAKITPKVEAIKTALVALGYEDPENAGEYKEPPTFGGATPQSNIIEIGTMYNLALYIDDFSRGIHNPVYFDILLTNTQEKVEEITLAAREDTKYASVIKLKELNQ